jgi:fucose 4-O-acetylase-like acetyltransferase
MTGKQKINWLAILQGWAMLWVVVGHSFLGTAGSGPRWENALFKFAYSFHMPLFMLISGWLFYYTRLKINILTGGAMDL